jgi:alpha-N-arabinofuranosidase
MNNQYHVSKKGSDNNKGTRESPFLTINRAAQIAKPGEVVTVHEGTYREWVNPKFKGLSKTRPVTYQAAEGENVVIKGSEIIEDWEHFQGNVYKTTIPNQFFGDFNPYTEIIFGDWVVSEEIRHLGDVYLNGLSFYEVNSLDEVLNREKKTEAVENWTKEIVPVHNPEQTQYAWYTENDGVNTIIYANFNGSNPREELVEINVRQACFYPREIGVDYITVRGFEMAHAATPWAPPTADQPGLIGAHWSKGWVIEDNCIHDSKCSAISIGKEISTGHNYRSLRKDKPGYQYQLESVFSARRFGWSREKIGSHIIRNNTIYDCGQNAIVGHLGCVFSEIYNNHIYNIAVKREYYGHEIAGIKLHGAIDVQIYNNTIHDCTLGLWLDWQAQGTRISRNLFYDNNRDFFVEVSHGPYIFDHNILASKFSIDNHAQGGAYINNLICGIMVHKKMLNRSTQYHLPHSTEIAGFALVYGGDDRFFNNIFVGKGDIAGIGTSHFNGYTTSLEEYIYEVHNGKRGDLNIFEEVEQPVYINNNAYYKGAQSFDRENDKTLDENFDPKVQIKKEDGAVYLSINLPDDFEKYSGQNYSTDTLPRTRIVDAQYENPDGSPVNLDRDFLNNKKDKINHFGPITTLKRGKNHIKLS